MEQPHVDKPATYLRAHRDQQLRLRTNPLYRQRLGQFGPFADIATVQTAQQRLFPAPYTQDGPRLIGTTVDPIRRQMRNDGGLLGAEPDHRPRLRMTEGPPAGSQVDPLEQRCLARSVFSHNEIETRGRLNPDPLDHTQIGNLQHSDVQAIAFLPIRCEAKGNGVTRQSTSTAFRSRPYPG